MSASRPLTGVRVLDFGLLTAGANTSAMLADLGADVIKIESGAYLDPFRVVGKIDNDEGWWNRSPQFRFTNRNKRGVAINLKDPEGQRLIRELATHCDVVVEISAAACSTGRGWVTRRSRPSIRRSSLPPSPARATPDRNASMSRSARRSMPPAASPPSPATRTRSRASRAWT